MLKRIETLVRLHSYTDDPLVLRCAEFLEAHGLHLLYDYGYRNAVAKARDLAEEEGDEAILEMIRTREAMAIIEQAGDARWCPDA